MKVKKTTIVFLMGAITMYSFIPIGVTPTVDFGEFRFMQGGIAIGLFMTGLILMIHATIKDMFNLNEKKHYFFIMEEKN